MNGVGILVELVLNRVGDLVTQGLNTVGVLVELGLNEVRVFIERGLNGVGVLVEPEQRTLPPVHRAAGGAVAAPLPRRPDLPFSVLF